MTNHLMPYMLYSREMGSEVCACLAFAHSIQEARQVGWRYGCKYDIAEEFTDLSARSLKNRPWLFNEADKQKLANDEAHLVFAPASCRWCLTWGHAEGPISRDELCPSCMITKYDAVGAEIRDEIFSELRKEIV